MWRVQEIVREICLAAMASFRRSQYNRTEHHNFVSFNGRAYHAASGSRGCFKYFLA